MALKETGRSKIDGMSRMVELQDEASGERIWVEAGPTPEAFERALLRLVRTVREASDLYRRGGGVLGTMPVEEAFDYLQKTERGIGDLRKRLLRRMTDGVS